MRKLSINKTLKNAQFEAEYAQKKCALWLTRLLKEDMYFGEEYFKCLGWAFGNIRNVLNMLIDVLKGENYRKYKKIISQIEKTISEEEIDYEKVAEIYKHDDFTAKTLSELIIDFNKRIQDSIMPEKFALAQKSVLEMFGFDKQAYEICEMLYLIGNYYEIEEYFEDEIGIFHKPNRYELELILNIPTNKILSTFEFGKDLSVILPQDDEETYFRLSESFQALWSEYRGNAEKHFFTLKEHDTLPLSDFALDEKIVSHIKALLSNKIDLPTNILLYGKAGSGKSTFAHSLAKDLGLKLFCVNTLVNDSIEKRRTALAATTHVAQTHENAIVLVDEAEALLDTSGAYDDWGQDKAWLASFLDKKEHKNIWIVNSIDQINTSILRRFCYSVHFDNLPQKTRSKIFEKIIKKHQVSTLAKDLKVSDLCRQFVDVPVASFDMAVKQSKALYDQKEVFCTGLISSLEAYQSLSQSNRIGVLPKLPSDFIPEGITIKGSISNLIDGCRKIDAELRAGKALPFGAGTLLFYGVSGSGKSALAKYIAETLDRECLIKRGSDILSKYVGESEQKIADAFNEAEKKGAILIFDEVDTLLFSRQMASHSWETSMVNEFLTSLENFGGICICTTNHQKNLDSASMRRFSYKVEFCYSKQEQVHLLYRKLLAPLCDTPISACEKARLERIKRLTPADFFNVKKQFQSFFSSYGGTHNDFLNALEREIRHKQDAKVIGF